MSADVPQDRPDAPDLLAAIARHLHEDLLPHVPGDQRFSVRVAANACAILAREWEAGPGRPDRSGQERLARAIRAGEWDDRWPEALATLRAEVAAKLAVARPGWADFADDGRG
ncbi:MAG: hypothetical protein QOI91_1406 [Solirubrobacteraceae bacterium]|jgi:hypothetical protein|nr:hypothetical protein [Solirubrobacteraceae bacterium]